MTDIIFSYEVPSYVFARFNIFGILCVLESTCKVTCFQYIFGLTIGADEMASKTRAEGDGLDEAAAEQSHSRSASRGRVMFPILESRLLRRSVLTQAARPSLRSAVVLLILMTLALPYLWSSTFSGFSWFDDEGTLLVSIRAFIKGHRMYDDVYSLYGPLYNIFYGVLYGPLHIPVAHVAGRLIALSLWLTWTAGFAYFCFRLSRSLVSMLLCFVLTLRLLSPVMESPGHPEELCLVLISLTLLMTCWLEEDAKSIALVCIGVAIAALTLIKINIGIFVGLPLLVVLLRNSSNSILSTILAPLAMICLIMLSVAVESLLFSFPWVRAYCLFCFLSIAATSLVYLGAARTPLMGTRSWAILVASGGVTSLLIVGAMMLAGSSAFAILNAVVLQNADFVRNWYVPIRVGATGVFSATMSLLAAGAYWVSGTQPKLRPYRKHAVLMMQSIFVLAGLWFCFRNSPIHIVKYLTPFCWLLLTSPDADATPFRTARSVTALIAATMLLYAFPVAGHQVHIVAVFPLIVLAVLARDVASALSGQRYLERVPLLRWMPAGIAALVFAMGGFATLGAVRAYSMGVELGLPGTSFIRVDRQRAEDLQWVSSQLSRCSASYSIPGLYSFSLWTGQALPTNLNVNAELNFLSLKQQQAIVDALLRERNLCVVYNPSLLKFFDRGQAAANPPLLKFASTAFDASSEHDGYIILRRHAGALSEVAEQRLGAFLDGQSQTPDQSRGGRD
jgi:hypothetical protein